MQLFKINPSTFQQTLTGEYDEFKKELKINSNLSEDVAPYIDGNILFSISQDSSALKELMTTAWSIAKDDDEDKHYRSADGQHYLNDVTTTIIKSSESFSLRDAFIQISEIVEALGDKLAGCLLVSGKTIINPLHPLSALVLIDEAANIFGEFKIITYIYKNKREMHYMYSSSKVDMSKIRKNIMLLISLYSNKQEINKVLEVLEVHSVNENNPLSDIERYYKESVSGDSKYEGDFIIIPHQLLTKGLVAPYYGTSVIIREDNTARGALLCPMHSANISSPLNKAKTEPKFDGVCTGSTPKTTMDGLRTLSHANLSSPLHSYCMNAGSILYADECIRQSINMYRLAGFLTKQPKESSISKLKKKVETTNLEFERQDAEHEAINNHDDITDVLSYANLREIQTRLGDTQRGIVREMQLPTDAFATGTTFTRTYTNATTPDEPPYIQPIRVTDVMINPEDTDIRYVDTLDGIAPEVVQEMQEEFGRRINEAGEETIREILTEGEQNEQEIEQTEPTTIFADALNEGAAEARAEREAIEEEPEQDGYEEQEREREEPVPREEPTEQLEIPTFTEAEAIEQLEEQNDNEGTTDPADLLEPETEAEQIREQWELAD